MEKRKRETRIRIVWYFAEGLDEVHGRDLVACVARYDAGVGIVGKGVAIRNPDDRPDMLTAQREALTDAVRHWGAIARVAIWEHALGIWRKQGLLPKKS